MGLLNGIGNWLDRNIGDSIGMSLNSILGTTDANNQTYQHSAALQQQNQGWQMEMANTAHQREVADLKAAGLNPALSAGGGGADTGSVTNGSPSGTGAGAGAAGAIIGTILDTIGATSASKLNDANAKLSEVNTKLAPALATAQVAVNNANAGNAKAQKIANEAVAELRKEEKEAQNWENTMNKELGTSKNDNSTYRSFKNAARSLKDQKYNPLNLIKYF